VISGHKIGSLEFFSFSIVIYVEATEFSIEAGGSS
jgi:hypothetical protein